LTRGFDSTNPPHAPLSFVFFRDFSRLTRAAPPFCQTFSANRGRIPLVRLAAMTGANHRDFASEFLGGDDRLCRFHGLPSLVKFLRLF